MARPKAEVPQYCFHVSGQASCSINGQNFYLGKLGSPQSKAKYAALRTQRSPARTKKNSKIPVLVLPTGLRNRVALAPPRCTWSSTYRNADRRPSLHQPAGDNAVPC